MENHLNENIVEITDSEILGIVIRIERQGSNFYREFAQHVTDPTVKEFLVCMAKEESQHEKQFEAMLSNKGKAVYGWEKEQAVIDLIEKEFQTDIFPNIDELFAQLPELESFEKAVDLAIESEKVSAEFYSLLGDYCNNFEAKTLLVSMEKAERDHLLHVEALKKQCLKKQKNSRDKTDPLP